MSQNTKEVSVSAKKLEANRRNARLSTGPRTEAGKNHSRRNALKHEILAASLLVTQGDGAEDPAEFNDLLGGLRLYLVPVGMLEELLVEKIAMCYWRQKRALRCEAGLIRRRFVKSAPLPLCLRGNPELEAITEDHSLPLGKSLDSILRNETALQRQLAHAINQLERLQRARKGEHVPAPVSVQISTDQEG